MRAFVSRALPGEEFPRLLAQPGLDVDVWPQDAPPPRAALLERVAGAHGLLCLISERIDAELLDAAGPQLKVVSQLAVGVDNVDLAACAARGIPVGNTPGVLTDTTADLAWLLIMASARRLVEAADYVRDGRWRYWTPTLLAGADVHGAALGIVGFGAIGQALARRAGGFGMRLRYWSRREKPEAAALGAAYAPLPDLLAASDFVSLHVALTPETEGLIDAAALRRMRPSAFLINTARGPVVDEPALIAALQARTIAGAGLDVTTLEPVAVDNPLLRMENVIVVPHIGSATIATRGRMANLAVINLRAGLRGDPLPHRVPPATGGESR